MVNLDLPLPYSRNVLDMTCVGDVFVVCVEVGCSWLFVDSGVSFSGFRA